MKTNILASLLLLLLTVFAENVLAGTEGTKNTFYGYQAGTLMTGNTNYYDTFVGSYAGYKNTTGYGNVFMGYNAG